MNSLIPYLKKISVLLGAFLLWEITVRSGLINQAILPPPSIIIKTLITLLQEASFWLDVAISTERVLTALLLAGLIGTALGLSMHFFKLANIILHPLIATTQPIPKIMLYPIFIILLGFGELSRILFIFLGCFYVIAFAAYQGAKNTDPNLLDAARSFGASKMRIFSKVVFPSAIPFILGGFKSAVGLSLILMFFSETIGTKQGLGYFVMLNWNWLNMAEVFAGIIVTSIIGLLLVALVELIEYKLLIWKKSSE